ncbi:hypothetical protein EX30DRAFT_397827 [Ascodesmis nigricans]|uniref:Uncharacterized protein n=1 Tax=Ascodesmis nigricans TaxID=341454 RepID=A0A4V3SI16_9PEZI|nr:hypothetical protein EX30DRAFT_397827 [Ascodesmis nigricans]
MVILENRRTCYCGLRDEPHEIDRGTVARHRKRCKERGINFEAHGKPGDGENTTTTATQQMVVGPTKPSKTTTGIGDTTQMTAAKSTATQGLEWVDPFSASMLPNREAFAGSDSALAIGMDVVDPALLAFDMNASKQAELFPPPATSNAPFLMDPLDYDIEKLLDEVLAENPLPPMDDMSLFATFAQGQESAPVEAPQLQSADLIPTSNVYNFAPSPPQTPSTILPIPDSPAHIPTATRADSAPPPTLPFNFPPKTGPTHPDEFRYSISQPKKTFNSNFNPTRTKTTTPDIIPKVVPAGVAGGRERATSMSTALGLPVMRDEGTKETLYWINGHWQKLCGRGSEGKGGNISSNPNLPGALSVYGYIPSAPVTHFSPPGPPHVTNISSNIPSTCNAVDDEINFKTEDVEEEEDDGAVKEEPEEELELDIDIDAAMR